MSFLFELDPAKEASAVFIAEVGRKLQAALLERKFEDQLTQSEIARRIGVDRSRVNRCFSGHANLTIGTLAEIAWALNMSPDLELLKAKAPDCLNYYDGCEESTVQLGVREVFLNHPTKHKITTIHPSISVYELEDV